MKKSALFFLTITLLMSSVTFAQSAPAKTAPKEKVDATQKAPAKKGEWERIPTPPLPPFKPAEPIRIQLSNGMVIFLQEDHELPLVDATMRIRGGSREEPAAKAGMVDIYGDVWRTGGTKTSSRYAQRKSKPMAMRTRRRLRSVA